MKECGNINKNNLDISYPESRWSSYIGDELKGLTVIILSINGYWYLISELVILKHQITEMVLRIK